AAFIAEDARRSRGAKMDVATEVEAAATADDAPAGHADTDAERLSRDAWAAHRGGNRAREAALLRQAIATGVQNPGLLSGLLNRLCDAEYALGNDAAGDAACQRVIREFADQGAAEVAARRMRSRAQAVPAAAPAEAPPPTRPFDR
ncbi:MAG: hypothetical protein WBV82_29770, partial [Myxococcaceae bacterium]